MEQTITAKRVTIGLDIAKKVFQVHAVDASGKVLARKRLTRSQVVPYFAGLDRYVVGMEACATAHHWGRALAALGHEVRLLPPSYVKPYVKRGKTDAADAEAICEAATRPTMRLVPVKTPEQQAMLALHRVRDLLIKCRTQLINALRGLVAEFGLIAPKGRGGLAQLGEALTKAGAERVPSLARPAFAALEAEIGEHDRRVCAVERAIVAWHRGSAISKLAASAAGVGPIVATAVLACAGDMTRFRSGRHFAAWVGLTPRLSGTGGKVTLGPVSKMGNRYLRRLLVLGATSLLRQAENPRTEQMAWLKAVCERRPARVAALAQANKTARILWAILTTGVAYEPKPFAPAFAEASAGARQAV
jgi:transposase